MLIICQINAKPELFDLKKVLDTAIRNYLLENFEKKFILIQWLSDEIKFANSGHFLLL